MKTGFIAFLVIVMISINYPPCLASSATSKPGGFLLEIGGENNLFPLDVTMKRLKKELPAELEIPGDILYGNRLFLSMPLVRGRTSVLGLFYRKAGFIHATGETLRFYRCYANPDFPHEKKYYDLAGEYLNYSLFGGYVRKEWNHGPSRIALRGDFLACNHYEKLNVQGQGWIKYRLGGSKYYNIFGNYRQEWLAHEDPWGWGLAVSGDFHYQQNGLTLDLNLQNIPAWLYFPQLKQENGRVDTEEDSIGPLPISGFKTESAAYRRLPPTFRFQTAYTVEGGGRFSATVRYNGCDTDLLLAYRQPVGDIGLMAILNPVYRNYGFGLDFQYAVFFFMFGLERPGILRGLSFKLQF